MRSSIILLLAALAAGPLLGQDDSPTNAREILKNSTFADGTTYWHGDCKPAISEMTTDFTSGSSSSGGLLVDLHSSSWTRVTQELRDKAATASSVLTVKYQVSSDFKLSDRASDYGNFAPNVGFGGANIPSVIGQIVAFFDVPPLSRASVAPTGGGYTQVTIFNDSVSYSGVTLSTDQAPQSFTLRFNPPPPTSDSHQTFCIALPPGHGSVTFTKISLTPGQPSNAPSTPNP